MKRVSIVNLETLCWIARLGTFTAAAERLHTTQSAISGRIHELEDALQTQLFERQGRNMALTMQGRELVERSQPLLEGLDDLLSDFASPLAARGRLRIGVGEIVSMTWFGRMMKALAEAMPMVHYDVDVELTARLQHELEAGRLDLAITAGPLDTRRLSITRLGHTEAAWLVAAPLQAALAARGHGMARALADLPLWSVASPSPLYPTTLDDLRRHGLPTHGINTCDHIQSIVELVADGGGAALLPLDLAAGHLRRGELVRLAPDMPALRLDFIVARKRDHRSALVERVAQAARAASQAWREGSGEAEPAGIADEPIA